MITPSQIAGGWKRFQQKALDDEFLGQLWLWRRRRRPHREDARESRAHGAPCPPRRARARARAARSSRSWTRAYGRSRACPRGRASCIWSTTAARIPRWQKQAQQPQDGTELREVELWGTMAHDWVSNIREPMRNIWGARSRCSSTTYCPARRSRRCTTIPIKCTPKCLKNCTRCATRCSPPWRRVPRATSRCLTR